MKRIFFNLVMISLFTIITVNAYGQEVRIDRQVIGTGGMVAKVNDNNITMSGITGQLAIQKLPGTEPVINNMIVDVYQGFWVPLGNSPTGVEDYTSTNFGKIENFPNPFSTSTIVKYNLPSDGFATVKIYDMVGNVVKVLFSGHQSSGDKEISWNGKDELGGYLSSGSYIYELTFVPTSSGSKYNLRNIMVILK